MEQDEKTEKKIYKKWWFWLLIILIIIVVGASSDTTNTEETLNETNSNTTVENTSEINEGTIENLTTNDTISDNTISDNKPSNENYKKYIYEIFDNYYSGDYNFSGDESDWNIVNTETSSLYRSKLEGVAIIDNQRYNFVIIIEFSDNTYTDYTVVTFEIGETDILESGTIN